VSYADAYTAHQDAARARLEAAAATARGRSNQAEAVELCRAQMHRDIDQAVTDVLATMPPPRRPILRTRPYRDTTGTDPR
jgi:hypothetical protein